MGAWLFVPWAWVAVSVVLVVGGWVLAAGSVGCGSGESCELGEGVQDGGGPWPVRVEVDDPAASGVDVAGGGGEEFQPQGLGLCDAPGAGEGELLGSGGEVHGEQDDVDPDGVGSGIGVGQVRPRRCLSHP